MSKGKHPSTTELLRRLQQAFHVGDYVTVRRLAQELASSDDSRLATAQSWVERTQNDPVNLWLALPVALLVLVAVFLTAG